LVDLSERVRVRIWKTLLHYDFPVSYQPDPYDNWMHNSTGLRELPETLERIYGIDSLTAQTKSGYDPALVLTACCIWFLDSPDTAFFVFFRGRIGTMG